MQAIAHAADVQDRDGGVLLMGALFGLYPFLLKLYADSGYQGTKFRDGLAAACAQVSESLARRWPSTAISIKPPPGFPWGRQCHEPLATAPSPAAPAPAACDRGSPRPDRSLRW